MKDFVLEFIKCWIIYSSLIAGVLFGLGTVAYLVPIGIHYLSTTAGPLGVLAIIVGIASLVVGGFAAIGTAYDKDRPK